MEQGNSNGINLCTESQQASIDIKQEIPEELEIPKRPYYQCITCSATFTKSTILKDHATIHRKGKNFYKLKKLSKETISL